MNTRSRIFADCVNAEDSAAEPDGNRNYRANPCSAKFSLEAIAQARLIYKLNTDGALRTTLGLTGVAGSTSGVSADIESENVLPGLDGAARTCGSPTRARTPGRSTSAS